MAVAVKIRKPKSHHDHAQWKTEVLYLSRFGHPKIVKLIGFCSEGNHLALVYEYVERGSLDNYLLGGKRDGHPLSWALRIKVAKGIAEGLSFLHDAEIPTIFRDVKSSNVLLDAEFNVKLTDFALAMAGHAKDEHHISTDISGTYGYAAPEYLATGNLSVKSDVYSFGVVLLELLSGLIVFDKTRYNAKGSSLVEWTKPYLGYKKKLIKFMDPKLEGQYPEEGANAVAKIVLQCLRNDPKVRPRMAEVLTALSQLQDME